MKNQGQKRVGEVHFYHLTKHSINEALRPLLNKCLAQDWRVLVRGGNLEVLKLLDEELWEGEANYFLPHGLWGGKYDSEQPILLAPEDKLIPHDCLICISSASLTNKEASQAERICIVFQDDNTNDVNHARLLWKTLSEEGVPTKYWSQLSGSWELKAETDPK